LLDTLIPEAYMSTVYTCLLDGTAAEHGARMSAMDSAVTNCKDAIKSQTLKMNKLRQAAITTELIEVVSGAESLKG
ncbi:F0F1 ATP synthase subunit gamma, partial [Bacteriovoracaceae bacterium]|nr:F0F1 ATP synthase subunit gamma [Bacteriovoracaceae bacterium]